MIEPGQQLLHYRLIEKIGEGGMGVVWKAEDTRLHRFVALKFISEDKAKDTQAVERHLREARAASALNHPNICSIYDIGEFEGSHFIVMELLEGLSLQHRIGSRPMDVEVAIDLATQLTDALIAAHAKGIVHRDIKPANVMVVEDGSGSSRAKILDFGLAKLAAGPTSGAAPDDATQTVLDLTTPGAAVGTVSYMSPEQALGKELDRRTDIFSLGVVLYEMITARRAFEGNTSAAVFDAILNRAPTAPVELNRKVPEELSRIINKALEKDPALRYQGAADMCADLKRLRRDTSVDRSAVIEPVNRQGAGRKRVWGLAAAFLVVVLGVLAIQQWTGSETAPVAQRNFRGPSIAVLPFTNAGSDPDQKYFSDGLTMDIITDLSRYHELTVVAYMSAVSYQGAGNDIREIGKQFQARYILQGSVGRQGDRIRVRVQLSDSTDGLLVWGTTYERDLTALDLFELQDELTEQVVNEIAGSYGALTRAELPGAHRKAPATLESYDCVLRAYEYFHTHTSEYQLAARECLEGVIETDPDYAEARAWLGYLYAEQYHHRWNEPENGEYNSIERALQYTEEAVRLDQASPTTHAMLSLALMFHGDFERAKSEAYRAVELNPNDALWLSVFGLHLVQLEDFEVGLPMLQKAAALLKSHPPGWLGMGFFIEQYFNGRYEEALTTMIGTTSPGDFRIPMYLAATYGQLGRPDEAKPALDEMQKRWKRPVSEIRQELVERHGFSPALADRLIEGLKKTDLKGLEES